MTEPAQYPPPTPATPPATRPDPGPVPLGSAPRPADGADLAARLRTALADELGERVAGLERAHVTAQLDGADIASAHVDLTGVVVRLDGTPAAPSAGEDSPAGGRAEVVRRDRATARRARLAAHRLVGVGRPVDRTVATDALGCDWVEGADGRVGIEAVEPSAERPVSGHARVSVDK